MAKLATIEAQMLAAPDQQVSLTDPDARSMATSGRGSGVVGYNVQAAVETEHHLIVAHEVINVGSDRSQLATMAKEGWSLTLGVKVSPAQVVLCLIDVKMARLARDPKHLDSQVDVAGYAACLREVTK